ncbi:MAG: serine/threonine-protein kinase [Polyangia bacterium]
MIDLAAIRHEFSFLSNIVPLGAAPSGQKDVLRAQLDGRDVVLKLIRASSGDERVQREIEAVAKLDSAYVPKVLDHGERVIAGARRLYLIEQLITGETLRSALDRKPVWPLAEVLTMTDVLLRACASFEQARLVHRDIKPANIMVDAGGKIWIIDFGIVRHLDQTSLTPTAERFGPFTPGYAAPEQMRNLKAQINSRADLFSVGVVLYEIATGSNPYLVGKRSVLEVIDHMEKVDLPRAILAGDHDGVFAEFLSALTARFPSRRPQLASHALDWFRPISEKLTATATPKT